jgi:hypothetical protein
MKVDDAIVAGAFALGGVALGGALEWLRSSVTSRQLNAQQRDYQFAALGTACTQLLLQIRMLRQSQLARIIPGNTAEQLRTKLLPVLAEITLLGTQLSMQSDEHLRVSSRRVNIAAASLLEHTFDKDGLSASEDELQAALARLRDARDHSATNVWRFRKRRELRTVMQELTSTDK